MSKTKVLNKTDNVFPVMSPKKKITSYNSSESLATDSILDSNDQMEYKIGAKVKKEVNDKIKDFKVFKE